MSDILAEPLTDHERRLVLAGVEWMRSQAVAAAHAVSDRAAPCEQSDAYIAADDIAAIPPPRLTPARLGVLGEG